MISGRGEKHEVEPRLPEATSPAIRETLEGAFQRLAYVRSSYRYRHAQHISKSVAIATSDRFQNMSAKERFAAHLLHELKKEGGGISFDGIAALLGVTKPVVYKLMTTGKGLGPKFEEAVAGKWFGGSLDKFRKAAEAWAKENPSDDVESDIFDRDPRVDARNGFVAQAIDDGHSKEDISAALAHVDGSKSYKGKNTYDAWFQAYREALRNLRAARKGKANSPFGIGSRRE